MVGGMHANKCYTGYSALQVHIYGAEEGDAVTRLGGGGEGRSGKWSCLETLDRTCSSESYLSIVEFV